MSTISDNTINRVWAKTVRLIAYKTYGLDLSKAAGDMGCYHETKRHAEMMSQGRLALSRLDGFLKNNGVSSRDIGIYKDRALFGTQTDNVCRKYSIKPSNLYKIVCV